MVGAGALGVFAAAAADGDVAEGAAVGPVAAAGLAEVAGLGVVVVVVVAELGVGGVAAWARQVLLLRRRGSSGGGLGLGRSAVLAGIRRRHLVVFVDMQNGGLLTLFQIWTRERKECSLLGKKGLNECLCVEWGLERGWFYGKQEREIVKSVRENICGGNRDIF